MCEKIVLIIIIIGILFMISSYDMGYIRGAYYSKFNN